MKTILGMTIKLYAPNLHCFAFQLVKEDPDRLWSYYHNRIQPHFYLPFELERRDAAVGRKAYLNPHSPDNVFQELSGNLRKQSITGLVCPLLLYDSYGLALNLRIPEQRNGQPTEPVDLDIFAQFNPNQIFRPKNLNSNLGQTILLTAWLEHPEKEQRENWPAIAAQIIKQFLGCENVPTLYQSGQLFGSPIYEYGSPKYPNQSGKIEHYLVWLFIDKTADHYVGDCYLDWIDLWFYRQKITTAYHYSRLEFADLKEKYKKIRQTVEKIDQELPDFDQDSPLSQQNLTHLKHNLKILPKLDLDYINSLATFKNRALTIEINTHDYQVTLERIATKTSPHDLTVLAVFGETIAPTFQHQIIGDLGYFDQGSQLVEKAIASIRGIVEIDQAERDRALEHQIQAVGIGIAAGAIVASSSGLILAKEEDYTDFWGVSLHPLGLALLASVVCAVGSWLVAKRVLGGRSRR